MITGDDFLSDTAVADPLNTLDTKNDAAVTTAAEIAPPAAPSNLTATAASARRVDLSWIDNSNDEDGFKVRRIGPGEVAFAEIQALNSNATNHMRPHGATQHHLYLPGTGLQCRRWSRLERRYGDHSGGDRAACCPQQSASDSE